MQNVSAPIGVCCLRRLAMDMDQDILDIRLLTPYAVHPDTANSITDQPEPRSRFHRLLLLGVAREDDLRSMAFGEQETMMRLAGRQHPRFIDDNGGMPVNLDAASRGKAQQFVDAERPRVDVVAKRHRRGPGHGGGNNALSVFAVEIGDGPQCHDKGGERVYVIIRVRQVQEAPELFDVIVNPMKAFQDGWLRTRDKDLYLVVGHAVE